MLNGHACGPASRHRLDAAIDFDGYAHRTRRESALTSAEIVARVGRANMNLCAAALNVTIRSKAFGVGLQVLMLPRGIACLGEEGDSSRMFLGGVLV